MHVSMAICGLRAVMRQSHFKVCESQHGAFEGASAQIRRPVIGKKKQQESNQADAVIAINALGRRSAISKSDVDGGLSGKFLAKTPGLEAQGVWTAGKGRRVYAHYPNGGYPRRSKLQAPSSNADTALGM